MFDDNIFDLNSTVVCTFATRRSSKKDNQEENHNNQD